MLNLSVRLIVVKTVSEFTGGESMKGCKKYLVALITNPFCLAVAVIYPDHSRNIEDVDRYYNF